MAITAPDQPLDGTVSAWIRRQKSAAPCRFLISRPGDEDIAGLSAGGPGGFPDQASSGAGRSVS